MSRSGNMWSAFADGLSDGDGAVREQTSDERQSVSELVRNYGDPITEGQKRDRSESGDQAPAGKRGALERSRDHGRSPSSGSFKEHLDAAVDGLESRISLSLSRDLHEFREVLTAEISKLNDRLRDLERHVEEKDSVISELTNDLHQSRREVSALQTRLEDAEINSRMPCLVLSGSAMAPRHAARLVPPLPGQPPAEPGAMVRPRPADSTGSPPGQVQVTSRPADRGVGAEASGGSAQSASGRSGARGGSAGRSGGWEQEDVNSLIVHTLNSCLPGLDLITSDIDRAHRLPGPNNRVIVRFVRSGQGSAREQVMSRRLELRGRDLFVNESLTKLRGLIYRSLLAARREKKVYTVFSRGGQVYYKEQQHGVSTRVDSLQRLRELGFSVAER